MLESIFKKLNVGNAEGEVYAVLAEDGPFTAGNLARKMHIPRSSLYGYLETLRAKGLVRQSNKYDKKIWQAEPVETIGKLIQDDIDRLSRVKEEFTSLLPSLKEKQSIDFLAPTVTSFEGREGMKQMFRDILLYSNIQTVAFWSMKDTLQFLGQDFMEELSAERIRNKISLRAIWPEGKAEDASRMLFLSPSEESLRDIRIAPRSLTTAIGYWVYENKTLFISSKKESFGFIVESKELADMLRGQFEIFWMMSKPIKTLQRK